MEGMSITFIDEKNNRSVSYDSPVEIKIVENGAVKILCDDNFRTIINAGEWTKIEIEKW
jgi:hypothetical protein